MSLGRNGIQSWANHSVKLDFKNLRFGPKQNKRPSDIDMFYLHGSTLILADGKNAIGEFSEGQRSLYKALIDSHRGGGYFFYFVHDVFQQNGDDTVDVAQCLIQEYYYKGQWRKPLKPTTMYEALHKIIGD